MSDILDFTMATGRLTLSRAELVALAHEVGADRVRGLDGRGLLHLGVDTDAAQTRLEQRALDRSRADVLGSEAAWVRQRLALLRLDRPGDRAALVLRHEADRLVAHLLAAGDRVACVVSTSFDQPVTVGPLTTLAPSGFLVEDLEPPELPGRAWACTGLTPPAGIGSSDAGPADGAGRARLAGPLALGLRDAVAASPDDAVSRLVDAGLPRAEATALVSDIAAGALPVVRVVGWWRHGEGGEVAESSVTWIVGRDRLWLVNDRAEDDGSEVEAVAEAVAARALATTMAEVLR